MTSFNRNVRSVDNQKRARASGSPIVATTSLRYVTVCVLIEHNPSLEILCYRAWTSAPTVPSSAIRSVRCVYRSINVDFNDGLHLDLTQISNRGAGCRIFLK